MYRTEVEQLEEALAPIIEARNAYLIEVTFKRSKDSSIVEVFIDAETGVTSELCTELSREFNTTLESFDFLQGHYSLVVSSPGFDRPLKFPKQYPKHRGHTLSVKHKEKENEKVLLTVGELLEVDKTKIIVKLENDQTKEFTFEEIIEAKVKPKW